MKNLAKNFFTGDFILESKIEALNKNKNWKQPDRQDAILFYLGNKWIAELKKLFTSSSELIFWRYEKVSKKDVNLSSFLQCWVYIFLGPDGCVWKMNLRILWNHIINVQVKHGQCDSIILPSKHFFLKSLMNY